jgi:hypothetical protein
MGDVGTRDELHLLFGGPHEAETGRYKELY